MEDPAETLARLEDLRTAFRDLREMMEKDGPMLEELARRVNAPLPRDPKIMAAQAAWVERIATRAIVRLSERIGVEPMGVHRDRPVRRNRKPPPGG